MEWPTQAKPARSKPLEGSAGIVLPVRDNLRFFKLAFHSVLDFTDYRFMLALVNNMSSLKTVGYLDSLQFNHGLHVLSYQKDHNQAAEWNLGIRLLFGFPAVQFGVCLTPNVVLEPLWLSKMIRALTDASAGIAFPMSRMPDDRPSPFCFAFTRQAFETVGGFDEKLPDGKWAAREFQTRVIQAGFRRTTALDTYVHHFEQYDFDSRPADVPEPAGQEKEEAQNVRA
jgi:hypothetical protein